MLEQDESQVSSPQIEFRPEVTFYRSFDANAFNGNSNHGIAPNRNYELVLADGRSATVFRDMRTGRWQRQSASGRGTRAVRSSLSNCSCTP